MLKKHYDKDNGDEYRKLTGDGAFPCETTEGGGDKEGQNRDDYLLNYLKNNILELLKNTDDGVALGPNSGKTNEDGEHQCAHNAHYLRNVELEYYLRQSTQTLGVGYDAQAGDDAVACCHRKQSCKNAGNISENQSDSQHSGSAAAELGDRGGDKAYDDERNAEINELTHYVLEGNYYLHNALGQNKTQCDAYDYSQQKLCGKAGKKFVHG